MKRDQFFHAPSTKTAKVKQQASEASGLSSTKYIIVVTPASLESCHWTVSQHEIPQNVQILYFPSLVEAVLFLDVNLVKD